MRSKTGTTRVEKVRSFQDRYLLFLNYAMDPKILQPWLPEGTAFDLWDGRAWLSLVGLTFRNAQAFGVRLPFQQDFEQIHLRFYVQRQEGLRRKRGVVFLREVVAKPLLAPLARSICMAPISTCATAGKRRSLE